MFIIALGENLTQGKVYIRIKLLWGKVQFGDIKLRKQLLVNSGNKKLPLGKNTIEKLPMGKSSLEKLQPMEYTTPWKLPFLGKILEQLLGKYLTLNVITQQIGLKQTRVPVLYGVFYLDRNYISIYIINRMIIIYNMTPGTVTIIQESQLFKRIRVKFVM